MLRVGLTGGIGSGKSTVARLLAANGAVVVDADAIAREVLGPGTAGLAEVVAEFGPGILAGDGSLDRAALGREVFADPARLRRLEAITHPRIAVESQRRVFAAPADAVVVYDVPLLVEKGLAAAHDVVVVVEAPVPVRLARLAARGVDEATARARISAQASEGQRRAVADFVVDNGGDLPALERAVSVLWQALAERARQGAGDEIARPGGGRAVQPRPSER
jgi:dephospho-CoA kinase